MRSSAYEGSQESDGIPNRFFGGVIVARSLVEHSGVAHRIGKERLTDHGTHDTSGGGTIFWLESTLRISAEEQVAFLRRLWTDQLSVSQRAQKTTRALMELAHDDAGRTLFGKTGTGGDARADIANLGWFIGCVSKGDRRVFFATRIAGRRDSRGRMARKISGANLHDLGLSFWPRRSLASNRVIPLRLPASAAPPQNHRTTES